MRLSEMSRAALRTMPGMKQLIHIKQLHGREIGHFSGIFESSEEALLSARPDSRSTWDDEALVMSGISTYSSIQDFDWPVIHHLNKRVTNGTLNVVTDFGGHIGVKYIAYSQVIDLPRDMIWQVVEVPAIIREAKRRTSPETHALQFYGRLEDTIPCEVLLCSGSLQYAEVAIQELVARMPQKPPTIIVNKVHVSPKKAFFTVERYIKCLAYRVYGPNELAEARTQMGYTLGARWTIPHRDILVLHSRGIEHVETIGEVWNLSASEAIPAAN